jgi:hypothetical protein
MGGVYMEQGHKVIQKIQDLKSRAKQLTLDIPNFAQGSDKEELHKDALELLVAIMELESYLTSNTSNLKPATPQVRPIHTSTHSRDDEKNEINKIHRKLPRWASNQHQINSRILKLFFQMEKEGVAPITESLLMSRYGNDIEFQRNFSQMKVIAPKNHGKIFDVSNGIVGIWGPVEKLAAEYRNQFLA